MQGQDAPFSPSQEELAKDLEVDVEVGLTVAEARGRIEWYGPNRQR